jgi:hypothetical protein
MQQWHIQKIAHFGVNTTILLQNMVRSESRCALIKLLEVMSKSVDTGLIPFNFITLSAQRLSGSIHPATTASNGLCFF